MVKTIECLIDLNLQEETSQSRDEVIGDTSSQ